MPLPGPLLGACSFFRAPGSHDAAWGILYRIVDSPPTLWSCVGTMHVWDAASGQVFLYLMQVFLNITPGRAASRKTLGELW